MSSLIVAPSAQETALLSKVYRRTEKTQQFRYGDVALWELISVLHILLCLLLLIK